MSKGLEEGRGRLDCAVLRRGEHSRQSDQHLQRPRGRGGLGVSAELWGGQVLSRVKQGTRVVGAELRGFSEATSARVWGSLGRGGGLVFYSEPERYLWRPLL